MKLKNIVLRVVMLALATFITIGLFQNAKASQDLSNNPKYFGVRIIRDSDQMGYAIGNPKDNGTSGTAANIWDIKEFESESENGDSGKNVNAYCIKAGVGFTDVDSKATYNASYDFKTEKQAIINLGSEVLNSVVDKEYYYNILAMADLLYLPGVSTTYEKEKLLTDADCGEYNFVEDCIDFAITDDQIEAIQQAAIWYYTNHGEDTYDKTQENEQWFTCTKDGTQYEALINHDRFTSNGKTRQQAEEAIKLYNYLIKEAGENALNYKDSTAKSKTKITLYTSKTSTDTTQPIIIIERESGEFDLALRKYITEITTDGKTLNLKDENKSREPNIDKSTLTGENGNTTATYRHRKDPVEVKKGSIVTYKITIYNEGEVAGRAEEVIDQLPDGLEFNDTTVIGNFIKESYNTSSNRIVFKRKNDNQNNLNAYTGSGDLNSETIEFQCKVTKDPSEQEDIVLTNIAWISKEYNAEKEITITNEPKLDRDSTPEECPKIGGSDVNKDNMKDYKGDSQNNDVTPSNPDVFYKGQEDDDDFEKLILAKKITGSYKLKIIKVDSRDVQNKLSGAIFTVNGSDKSATDANGEVIVEENKKIEKSEQTDIYTIEEKTAPAGYNKFGGTIKLNVKTKEESGKYVVDTASTTMTVTDASGSVMSENTSVTMDKTTGQITITVKDTPITGNYGLKIVKVGSTNDTKLSGAVFTVNGEAKPETQANGEVIVESNKKIEKLGQIDNYTIQETTAPTGYNKFGGTIEVNVQTKEQNGQYVIDTEKTTMTVKDARGNDIRENIPVTMDKTTGQITITVEDMPITGNYSLKIVKVNSTNNNKLSGAVFTVDGSEKPETGTTGEVIVEDNKAIPSGNYTQTYTIKEKTAPAGYNKFDGTIKVNVQTKEQNGKYVIDTENTTMTVKDAGGNDIRENIPVTMDKTTGQITITVEDTPITGIYGLKIVKIDSENSNPLSGAVFTVNEKEESATESNGEVIVESDKKITSANYTHTYKIQETTAPNGYNKFDGTIEVNVQTKEQNGQYVIDTEKTTMTVKDASGSVMNENTSVTMKVQDGLITITVKDTLISGNYSLKIMKVDSKSKNPLSGANFKVTLSKEDIRQETTTEEGSFSILNIPITEIGTDTITIEEINPPSGYKKLLNSVRLEVTKTVEGESYKATKIQLQGAEGTQIQSNLENGIITITIPNEEKTFDLALRKYITKIMKPNNEEKELKNAELRVPNIDESTLKQGNGAKYKHIKDPVEVETGDKVIYKITIYNEGEKLGRATKIVDQLPTGLKFLRVVNGNFKVNPELSYNEAGNNTLNLIREDENEENLPAYASGNLTGGKGSETIEIECQVTRNSRGR